MCRRTIVLDTDTAGRVGFIIDNRIAAIISRRALRTKEVLSLREFPPAGFLWRDRESPLSFAFGFSYGKAKGKARGELLLYPPFPPLPCLRLGCRQGAEGLPLWLRNQRQKGEWVRERFAEGVHKNTKVL